MLRGEADQLGVPLTLEAAERLLRYERLLVERAAVLGLVSGKDIGRIRERHILDSLRAAVVVRTADTVAYDLGSGAGLPGLVVAIARPRLHVTLIESARRRAAFLELAVDTLDVPNATVVHGRVEAVTLPADLCFARALAPLQACWEAARGLLGPSGRLVYFAGRDFTGPIEMGGGVSWHLVSSPVLESAGPLVIMTGQ